MRCARPAGPPDRADQGARRRAASPVTALAALAAAVGLLGASAPGTVGATGPVAAAAGPSALALVAQSPWVSSASPTFDLQVATRADVPDSALALEVTLYNRLTSRSVFQSTLNTVPGNGVLDRLAPMPLSGLRAAAGGGWAVSLPVTAGSGSSGGGPALTLDCGSGICSGVYPLVVQLVQTTGGAAVLGHFTTYLTYDIGAAANKVRFALVLPFGTPAALSAPKNGPAALQPPGPAEVAQLEALAASLKGAHAGTVPLTIDPVPQTLQGLARVHTSAARQTLADLAAAGAPAAHQVLTAPYVPVDVNALTAAGLTGELRAQVATGGAVLSEFHVAHTGGTWVVRGPAGSALARGLPIVGADHVVVPDADLAPVNDSVLTWGQPFTLALGHGQRVAAVAADAGLAAHLQAASADPVLAGNQLLADLAFIYFERPGAAVRGVVAVPPAGWTAPVRFVETVERGLAANPDVVPVTLDGLFAQVPAGANAAPDTRRLADPGTGPSVSAPLRQAMAESRLRLSSFDSAVRGAPLLLSNLDDLLLSSESSTRRPSAQAAGVADFARTLGTQLSLLQLATDRTITLTSRNGRIPITILSTAPYTVVGVLDLSSDKLTFGGRSSHATIPFVVSHATNSVRVGVQARTSGDLPLSVSLDAPRGGLPIVHGELTVRSTATSLVGIALTLAAAVVLAAWWVRTWRRGRRRRAGAAGGPQAGAAEREPADGDPVGAVALGGASPGSTVGRATSGG